MAKLAICINFLVIIFGFISISRVTVILEPFFKQTLAFDNFLEYQIIEVFNTSAKLKILTKN